MIPASTAPGRPHLSRRLRPSPGDQRCPYIPLPPSRHARSELTAAFARCASVACHSSCPPTLSTAAPQVGHSVSGTSGVSLICASQAPAHHRAERTDDGTPEITLDAPSPGTSFGRQQPTLRPADLVVGCGCAAARPGGAHRARSTSRSGSAAPPTTPPIRWSPSTGSPGPDEAPAGGSCSTPAREPWNGSAPAGVTKTPCHRRCGGPQGGCAGRLPKSVVSEGEPSPIGRWLTCLT